MIFWIETFEFKLESFKFEKFHVLIENKFMFKILSLKSKFCGVRNL